MKRITATTTDEQILARIQTAKDSLVIEATEAASSEYLRGDALVRAAQEVRNAEALAVHQLRYRDLLANDAPVIDRLVYLSSIGTNSDDTWSGRGNDSVRATLDVVRAWVSDETEQIKWDAREAARAAN